jgi:hypothetical protein
MTFKEFVAFERGATGSELATRQGSVEVDPLPTADGRRRLHVKPVKKPKPFAPTVRAVKEIVPNKLIPKLKPTPPRPPLP